MYILEALHLFTASPLLLLCSEFQPWNTSKRTICCFYSMAQICQIDSDGRKFGPQPEPPISKRVRVGMWELHRANFLFSLNRRKTGGKIASRQKMDNWSDVGPWGGRVIILKLNILLKTYECQTFGWSCPSKLIISISPTKMIYH